MRDMTLPSDILLGILGSQLQSPCLLAGRAWGGEGVGRARGLPQKAPPAYPLGAALISGPRQDSLTR